MGAREEIALLRTPRERSEYRARAAQAAVLSEKPKSGPMAMERNGLTLIFDADPELILNKRGEVIGVDAMIRAFRAGSEVKVDPHRICLNPPMLVPDGTYTEVTTEHAGREVTTLVPGMREDPRQAYMDWLFANVEQFPNPDGWRTKGTVTTVYSGTADGGLYSHGGTWANAYNGTGTIDSPTTSAVSEWIGSIYTGSEWYTQTVFLGFDTSSIPDTDTVSAATFSLYARNGNSSRTFRMRAWTYDWGGSLTTGDFRNASQLQALTELADWPPTNSVSTGAYTDFENTGNNLRDAINKTGTTYIIVSDNLHEAGTTNPLTADDCEWWLADQTGTTNDPKLVVTHAAGSTSATITGVTATATAAAGIAVIAAQKSVTIAGATATATASAPTGAVMVARAVSGVTATAAAAAGTGAIAAVRIVAVSGELAAATAAANAATIAAQVQATVSGAVAAAAAVANAATVATVRIVSVSGETAAATATANAGVISTGATVTVAGAVSAAAAAANAGTVATVRIVSVSGGTATATATANAAVISTGATVTVAGAVAASLAAGNAGTVATVQIVSVSGGTATCTAGASSGVVLGQQQTSVSGEDAAAGAAALAAIIAVIYGSVGAGFAPLAATAHLSRRPPAARVKVNP